MKSPSLLAYYTDMHKVKKKWSKHWKKACWEVNECVTFIHDKNYDTYEIWSWDSRGYAVSVQKLSREQFSDRLLTCLRQRREFLAQLTRQYS